MNRRLREIIGKLLALSVFWFIVDCSWDTMGLRGHTVLLDSGYQRDRPKTETHNRTTNNTRKNHALPESNPKSISKSYAFVPFPHLDVSETTLDCEWRTTPPNPRGDEVQQAAAREGSCLSPINTNNQSGILGILSQAQAQQCLQNTTLIFAGDSYTKQLVIGLVDILLGRLSNEELLGSHRRQQVLVQSLKDVDRYRSQPQSHWRPPRLAYVCTEECYGKIMPFAQRCTACLQKLVPHTTTERRAIVVGVGIHLRKLVGWNQTAHEMEMLQKHTELPGVIMVSVPSYQVEKLPTPIWEELSANDDDDNGLLYRRQRQSLMPFLDVFQLTRTCVWENCSVDGGHRTRFVNRFKAQLLLNMLCWGK